MSAPKNIGPEILRLRELGYTYNQIKEELKVSKGTISYHLGEGQKLKYAEASKRTRTSKYKKYYAMKDNPCTDCGKRFPPFLMHWDHMGNEVKLGEPSDMIINVSWQRLLDEIAKCELVCSNCHGLRTVKRSIEVGAASQLMIDYYNNYIEQQ